MLNKLDDFSYSRNGVQMYFLELMEFLLFKIPPFDSTRIYKLFCYYIWQTENWFLVKKRMQNLGGWKGDHVMIHEEQFAVGIKRYRNCWSYRKWLEWNGLLMHLPKIVLSSTITSNSRRYITFTHSIHVIAAQYQIFCIGLFQNSLYMADIGFWHKFITILTGESVFIDSS